MHRGVVFGVIAFGLLASLAGLLLSGSIRVASALFGALVIFALRPARGLRLRGSARETVAVALFTFGILTAALGVILGAVGGLPWLLPASVLLAVALVAAAAGAWTLPRRRDPATVHWHEQ